MFDLQDRPLTIDEREKLLQIVAKSEIALSAASAHREANEALRAEILSSYPARQKDLDRQAIAAEKTFTPLDKRIKALQSELDAIRQQHAQASCAVSAFSQRAAGLRDFVNTELVKLADPRINQVIQWAKTCGSKVENAWQFHEVLKRDSFGNQRTVISTNLDDCQHRADAIGGIVSRLESLQVSQYDQERLPGILEAALTEVESLLQGLITVTKPTLSRF